MNVQIDLNEEDAKLFTTMAKRRDMTLSEFMHYCAMKQAAQEYSFIVADEEDLGRKLQEAQSEVRLGKTYPAEEVLARLRAKLSENKSSDQQPD
nr:MAG TPA: RelB antitoxin [Caudoviricetes sp.]